MKTASVQFAVQSLRIFFGWKLIDFTVLASSWHAKVAACAWVQFRMAQTKITERNLCESTKFQVHNKTISFFWQSHHSYGERARNISMCSCSNCVFFCWFDWFSMRLFCERQIYTTWSVFSAHFLQAIKKICKYSRLNKTKQKWRTSAFIPSSSFFIADR